MDVLALMGDSIDNIKGVPGIGEKGAQGSDRARGARSTHSSSTPSESAAEIPRGAARPRRGRARRAVSCVTIRTDVPVPFDSKPFRYRGASRERCYELFSRSAFRSLVDGVRADG